MQHWNDKQLTFKLEGLDEVQDDAVERAISPEEARQISYAARQALEKAGDEQVPGWFQDYLLLIERGWPWRVACYIAWAASPKTKRWPETVAKLATDVLGLRSARAIYNWRENVGVDTTVAMMQAKPLFEHRREVIEALVEMAKRPDYKAFNDRKLFLEMIGDYVPRSQLNMKAAVKGKFTSEMSEDELRDWAGDWAGEDLNDAGDE